MIREDGTILFDPENCVDCEQMTEGWDEENHYNKIIKPYMDNYKNPETFKIKGHKLCLDERLLKDPEKERNLKWRKGKGSGHYYRKDLKSDRKKVQRKFKAKMKEKFYNEEYYKPVPHDYRTYGWETW